MAATPPSDLPAQIDPGTRVRVTYRCDQVPPPLGGRTCRDSGEYLSSEADFRWRSDHGDILATPLSALVQLERRQEGLSILESVVVVYLTTALGSLGGSGIGCLVGPKSEEDGCLVGAMIGFLIGTGVGFQKGRDFVGPRRARWVPVAIPDT